jgi:hypothetical protein
MKGAIKILLVSLCWSILFLCLGVFSGWLTISTSVAWLTEPAALLYRHLRLSLIPFTCLFLLYIYLINRIREKLGQEGTSLAELTYCDRLLNTTISTFFGVGVIWTAVGMETALIQALDAVEQGQGAAAGLSAWGILERLVNGGLLLALSTTIFGGICGYMLKLLKVFLLGNKWDDFVLNKAG